MRPCRLALLLALSLSSSAYAQTLVPCTAGAACPSRYYWESAPLTRPLPTAAPVSGTVGSGMQLAGTYGVVVSVCPETGQTLTGTGNLRAMVWDFAAGADAGWMSSPESDLAVTKVTTVNNRCQTWGDREPVYRGNRALLYAADGVGVSGGATVTVRVSGSVTQ